MPAIRVHHTATSTDAWDGPGNEAQLRTGGTEDYYRSAFAWQDPEGNAETKAAYRFIHHEVSDAGDVGSANVRACVAGIAVLNGGRGGTTIPDADIEGVYRHLAAHIKDAGQTPPELKRQTMKKQPDQKRIHGGLELKGFEEDGSFSGDLSVYDNVDYGGDVVEKGAFTKTLKESGGRVPLMAHHNDQHWSIGVLELNDGDNALAAKGKLNLDIPAGQEARAVMRFNKNNGLKTGLSIGFITMKDAVSNGIRYLKEVKLLEGSIVTLPMNPLAVVHDVKSLRATKEGKDFAAELEQIQALDLKYQLKCALCEALDDILYDDTLTPDEVASQSAQVISDFSAAYVAFIPRFLAARQAMMEDYGGMGWMARELGESKRDPMPLETKRIRDIISNLKARIGEKGTASAAAQTEPGAAGSGNEPEHLHSVLNKTIAGWSIDVSTL